MVQLCVQEEEEENMDFGKQVVVSVIEAYKNKFGMAYPCFFTVLKLQSYTLIFPSRLGDLPVFSTQDKAEKECDKYLLNGFFNE